MKQQATWAVIAVALAGFTSAASAQQAAARNFTGWGVGVSAVSIQNKFDVSPVSRLSAGSYDKTDTGLELVGSYGFALNPNWLVTFGIGYNMLKENYGTGVTPAGQSTLTARDHINLSVAPGYRVSDSGLVYGKLSVHSATFVEDMPAGSFTKAIGGTGWGLGYAWVLAPKTEARAEYESIGYEAQVGGTPRQRRFAVSLLYKF